MRKLRFFTLLASLLILISACTFGTVHTVSASENETVTYEVYIDDAADLLTDSEEQDLYETMSRLTEYGNMMFTTLTLDNGNYEAHAEDAYYQRYGNEPGVNFQIDMGNRKLTLSASTGMEDQISGERDSIVDNIYTYASDGDYAACATECFDEIYSVLHGGQIAHTMKHINNALVALILGLMINFLFVFASFKGSSSTKYLKKSMQVTNGISTVHINKGKVTKKFSPASSDSGGGGSSGGGGGGGGGFSGGSSSHGF